MTEQEFTALSDKGGVEQIPQPPTANVEAPDINDFGKYIAILEIFRRPKYHVTTAPVTTPKCFAEQIQFYDTGSIRRLYLYINGTWRYVTLT